jgi:hypothetical protein
MGAGKAQDDRRNGEAAAGRTDHGPAGSEKTMRETNLKVLDVKAQLRDSPMKWDTERRQLNDHAAHLQPAFVQAEAKMKFFEVAAQSSNASEEKVPELKRDKEGLQRQMHETQTAWDAERRRLEQQLQRMNETPTV